MRILVMILLLLPIGAAQASEILFCDPPHPKYQECQRQLVLQQQGSMKQPARPTLAAQQDPYRACTEAKGTYEQCRIYLDPESRARLDKWHEAQKQQAEASHRSSQRVLGQPYRGKQ